MGRYCAKPSAPDPRGTMVTWRRGGGEGHWCERERERERDARLKPVAVRVGMGNGVRCDVVTLSSRREGGREDW